MTKQTRLTFAVPQDMEENLDNLKKQVFYNRTQSEMLRTLLRTGIKYLQSEPNQVDKKFTTVSGATN